MTSNLILKNAKNIDFKLSDWQIEQIAKAIDVNEVKKYIEEHYEDYLKFLEEEKKKEKLSNKKKNDFTGHQKRKSCSETD